MKWKYKYFNNFMRKIILLIAVVLIATLHSFSQIDSTKDTLSVSEWKIKNDTLEIISSDDYLFYPFGKYHKIKI